MACPRCKSNKIVKAGNYKTKVTKYILKRWRCKDCKYTFIIRTSMFRKQISADLREKIKKMYKRQKGYIQKFDNQKKTTYSTREISQMLGVSNTSVWEIINEK